MPAGTLDQMMREQGVRVLSGTGVQERRGWMADVEAAAAIVTLVVEGGLPAIKAALSLYRRRFPKAQVEAEDDDGQPIGYL